MPERWRLGGSALEVFPLCLGGNVFGWTADEQASFAVLDRYLEAGGNFIDTADRYSVFVPGNQGGESETIIGRWLKSRGNREQLVIATKVGMMPGLEDLSPATIETAVEASLRRLQTDYIDLYYAHQDDPETPQEETLAAFGRLVEAGKVRQIAASNFTPERVGSALAVAAREGLPRFVAVQPQYSLVERAEYEGELARVCVEHDVSCVPFWALARGFLTGKYRPGVEVESARAADAMTYLDERGLRVLAALDRVAAAHETSVAAVALAWVAAQPGVTAPVASARTTEQLAAALPVAELRLSAAELELLGSSSCATS